MKQKKEWFLNWFDTTYYHLLYDYRNDEEAEFFMDNLIEFLKIEKGAKLLDLPCGKGRHSLYLNSKGFDVVGADLSQNSIAHAKHFENQNLRFSIHDMRDPLNGKYSGIFNLFTSFGYFEQEETNIKVLKNFKAALSDEGHLIIDFLNLNKVRSELIPMEHIVKKGVDYTIRKRITDQFIIKDIEVKDQERTFFFQEKVQAIDLTKLRGYASEAGLRITDLFGDYALNPYSEKDSDRLILVLS